MTTMQLSDIKPEKIKPTRRLRRGVVQNWDNLIYDDVDTRAEFVASIDKADHLRHNNLPSEAEAFHKNYMGYLAKCWADHLGVVFTPDILWYTLLSELSFIVKHDSNSYKNLFTSSDQKQDIVIATDELVVMPLNELINALKAYIPTDTVLFLPQFTTSTLRSRHAMYAAFADMCSPYYNYMMYCCDLPVIDVRGELSDYEVIVDRWRKLSELFSNHTIYMNHVGNILLNIVQNFNNADFWKKIFRLDKCGSGSDVVVGGWWKDLFYEQPSLAYPHNYSTHVAKVSYKQLNTQKSYNMYDGLFYSKMEGDFLVPNFGSLVYEDCVA